MTDQPDSGCQLSRATLERFANNHLRPAHPHHHNSKHDYYPYCHHHHHCHQHRQHHRHHHLGSQNENGDWYSNDYTTHCTCLGLQIIRCTLNFDTRH